LLVISQSTCAKALFVQDQLLVKWRGSKGGCRWDDGDGREQDEGTIVTRFRGVAPVKADLAVSSLDYVMGVAAPGSTKGELWSGNLPIWEGEGRAGASVWLDRRFPRRGATGNCVRCLAPSTTSRYFQRLDYGRCGANGLSMLAESNFQEKMLVAFDDDTA
jgi:hypothetical protein